MRLLRVLLVACLAVTASVLLSAASSAQSFTVSGAVTMPMGDFADDDSEDAGMAAMGFGAMMEYAAPLSADGFLWTVGAAILINPVDEKKAETFFGIEGGEADLELGSWTSIPLMGGLRYEMDLDAGSPTKLYGTAMLAMTMLSCPTFEVENKENPEFSYTLKLDSGTSFGLVLGGGVVLQEKYSIGLRYFALGTPELDTSLEFSEDLGYEVDLKGTKDQPLAMIGLTVGIAF